MPNSLKRVLQLSVFFSLLVGITAFCSFLPTQALNKTPASSIAASDTTPSAFPGRIIFVDRTALLDSFGTFFTKDDITYKNTGSEPVQQFYICLNETQTSQLYEMIVTSITGERYQYELLGTKLSGYNTWRITFPSPVMPGGETEFSVSRFFYGAFTSVINSTGLFGKIHHATFPITPYNTDGVMCKLTLPQGSDITEFLPAFGERSNNIVYFSANDIFPFFTHSMFVSFKHQSVAFTETERSIITITTGMQDWRVSNAVEIKNTGTLDLNVLTFTVPADAYDFSAEDRLSYIAGVTESEQPALGFKNVTINLLVNRYKITSNNKFSFTFSFRVPQTSARVTHGDMRSALFVDIFQMVRNPWIMRNIEIRIALPHASNVDFDRLNANPDAVDNQADTQHIIYRQAAAAPESSKVVTILYDYSGLSMQARPLIIALVVALAATFLIIGRKALMRYEQPVSEITAEIPLDALKEFTGIVEEKVAAYLDLDTLNDDFQRRKIKKREYQIKVEDLTRRIKLLDNQIRPSKRKLMEFGGRFKEIIEDLDLLEVERQSVQDSLITLERRYKDGQIKSRAAYEQLYDNNAVRLKKIQTSIDSGVNELKSYFT